MRRARGSQKKVPSAPAVSDTPSGIWQQGNRHCAGRTRLPQHISNSLSGSFIFDDTLSVVENPQIRQWYGDLWDCASIRTASCLWLGGRL